MHLESVAKTLQTGALGHRPQAHGTRNGWRKQMTSRTGFNRTAIGLTALTAALVVAGLGTAYADGDPAKGKAAFVRQCAICHTVDKGGDNRLGPNLFGIMGRKAGTVAGFTYTNAFKTRANWEWTDDGIGGWMMF